MERPREVELSSPSRVEFLEPERLLRSNRREGAKMERLNGTPYT